MRKKMLIFAKFKFIKYLLKKKTKQQPWAERRAIWSSLLLPPQFGGPSWLFFRVTGKYRIHSANKLAFQMRSLFPACTAYPVQVCGWARSSAPCVPSGTQGDDSLFPKTSLQQTPPHLNALFTAHGPELDRCSISLERGWEIGRSRVLNSKCSRWLIFSECDTR